VRAIDLFAGAGGLSLGLRQAGIDVVAAVERDPDACATYRANLGDHVIESSIEDVDAHALPDCDLIAGGPPCQGFSYAGKRDPSDPRNRLWREYWRIVEAKRPAWVLIENVRGMLTMGEDKPLILAFREIGYELTPYLLNAADYGVPQKRIRVFYVGNRLGRANPCPTPTHAQPPRHLLLGLQPWVTVRQALGIGGQMTHKYSVTERLANDGRTSPWYDGDNEPARMLTHEPHKLLDEPSRALRAGAHGQPGYSPRHLAGYVPTTRTDHGVLDLDDVSCAIKAGGNREADGHMGGACPPALPYVELDEPSPTIQGGGPETGGAEPVRHRLRGRASGDGDGQTFDEPAPTIPAQWSVDVVDPEIGRRTYTDSEGRQHVRPSNGAILRRLTVRECATLQDFPPDFVFCGNKTSQYRQVGNAIAVGMARAIGCSLVNRDNRAISQERPALPR
jgi:site-specific DNA-cytosine methylase